MQTKIKMKGLEGKYTMGMNDWEWRTDRLIAIPKKETMR